MQMQRRRFARLFAWAGLAAWPLAARSQGTPPPAGGRAVTPPPVGLAAALARARALRDEAVRSGDQAYGAVVIDTQGRLVGEAPSRVILKRDVDAHAEREALHDAARRLGTADLGGLLLVSSPRPCSRCEAAAAKAGIARMYFGEGTDAGAPQTR